MEICKLPYWHEDDIVSTPFVSNVHAMSRTWLRTGLSKPGKSGKGLARHLNVSESVVSKMLTGKRKIQAAELPAIAGYIEEPIPTGMVANAANAGREDVRKGTLTNYSRVTRLIEGRGIIAPGVWREGGVPVLSKTQIPAAPDPRLSSLDQYFCPILDEPNKFPICVPYSAVRPAPLAGDLVHVKRTRGKLVEETLRRVHIHDGAVELRLEDGKPHTVLLYPSADPHEIVTIEGLVVAYHINLFA